MLAVLAPSGAISAFASPITYQVTVDTSSESGQSGYIDIQLNPGSFATQAAMAQITNFVSGGVLNSSAPATTGAVSGALPGPLGLTNSDSTNEYTAGLTFGNTLTFDLTLSGPALSNPNGEGGGLFSLDFLNAGQSAYLFTADPQGNNPFDYNVGVVSINGDGSTTVMTYPDVNGKVDASFVPLAAIPEPANVVLLFVGLTCIAGLGWKRRNGSREGLSSRALRLE